MQSLWKATRRYLGVVAAAAVLAAATGLVARAQTLGRAAGQADQAAKPGRVLLDENVMKLAVVVMANQTPITQADAQAVLPVLESMQARLEEQRQTAQGPDDAAAAELDARLLAALSPKLQQAVGVVRLLVPAAPPAPAGPAVGGPPPGGAGQGMREGGRPGGPGGPHGRGGPGGPMGMRMLGPLVDFFRSTAAG
jgi:hypothetical protein